MPFKNKSDKAEWRRANRSMVATHKSKWLNSPKGKAYLEAQRVKRAKASALRKAEKDAIRRAKKHMANEAKLAYARDRSKRLRQAAIAALGGECIKCHITDERVLEFDHVKPLLRRTNGRTQKDNRIDLRKIIDGRRHGLQLLCANCHRIKTREANEWALRFGLGCVSDSEQQPVLC